MSQGHPDQASEDGGGGLPNEFVLLLTPDEDLRSRIDPDAFVGFAEASLTVVAGCTGAAPAGLAGLQVGCALLPGPRLIVDVQTTPPEARTAHAPQLTRRLRRLALPAVTDGAVVFARRWIFSPNGPGGLSMPFVSFVTRSGSVPLEDVLMEAGGASRPQPSVWQRLRSTFSPRSAPPTPSEPIAGALSRRVGVSVICCNGRLVVSGPPAEPFTVLDDGPGMQGFVTVRYPNGATGMVDRLMLDYLRTTAPQPTEATLEDLLRNMARVRVIEGGMAGARPLGNNVLLEVADEAALGGLREALAILDGSAGHCMCCGEPALELLSARNERLAVLGVHHGRSIRWARWKDDAALLDGRQLLDWLAERGVPGPLAAYQEEQRRTQESLVNWQRWRAAMPEGLRDLPDEAWQALANSDDPAPLETTLARAYPEEADRLLALFRWFGSGAGPWTGCPVYEGVPEQLLLRYPVPRLVAALDSRPLDAEHLEGAARFFAGHAFANRERESSFQLPPNLTPSNLALFLPDRQGEPAPLPPTWRQRLLAHCLHSGNEDKQKRGRSAFAD